MELWLRLKTNRGMRYLQVQECDEGIDYTVFAMEDGSLIEEDGGVFECDGMDQDEAVKNILEDYLEFNISEAYELKGADFDGSELDYDDEDIYSW